jgi:hypothetical protein
MSAPIYILNKDAKREQGKKAQEANIKAAKAVADIVRTTLGPKSMLKMLLDPMGGIVLTNDGNAILREIDVQHPAAKSMIELARAQDEEVGDGTTSVIILAGEVLSAVEGFLAKDIHPTVIVNAYFRALEEIVKITNELGVSAPFFDFSNFLYRLKLTSKTMMTLSRLSNPPLEPNSLPSGEIFLSTSLSKLLEPSTKRIPKVMSKLMSKDTPRSKRFQVVLLKIAKFLTVSCSTRMSLIQE